MNHENQKSGPALIEGHLVNIPNSTLNGDGFYISFNDTDVSIYGDVTTALVFGQMQKFYVLNGDHRKAYLPLIAKGFDVCLNYFKENLSQINKYSEKLVDDNTPVPSKSIVRSTIK